MAHIQDSCTLPKRKPKGGLDTDCYFNPVACHLNSQNTLNYFVNAQVHTEPMKDMILCASVFTHEIKVSMLWVKPRIETFIVTDIGVLSQLFHLFSYSINCTRSKNIYLF